MDLKDRETQQKIGRSEQGAPRQPFSIYKLNKETTTVARLRCRFVIKMQRVYNTIIGFVIVWT